MCHGLHQGAVEAIEEGLQETISTYGSNAIARQLYDEDRFLGEGALQAGQVGGTAGFIAGFALSALGVKGAAGMGRAPANWVIDEPLDKEGKHPSDPFVRLGFRHDGPRPRDDDPDDKELTEVWIHRVTQAEGRQDAIDDYNHAYYSQIVANRSAIHQQLDH